MGDDEGVALALVVGNGDDATVDDQLVAFAVGIVSYGDVLCSSVWCGNVLDGIVILFVHPESVPRNVATSGPRTP